MFSNIEYITIEFLLYCAQNAFFVEYSFNRIFFQYRKNFNMWEEKKVFFLNMLAFLFNCLLTVLGSSDVKRTVVLKAYQLGAKSTFGSTASRLAVSFPHQFCTVHSRYLETFRRQRKIKRKQYPSTPTRGYLGFVFKNINYSYMGLSPPDFNSNI